MIYGMAVGMAEGSRVETVPLPIFEESDDWSREAKAARRWGVEGKIVGRSNAHGLVWQVLHDDGTVGWYEPRELRPLIGASSFP